MARFYVKHADTKVITSDLRVSDLKVMAKDGRLKQNDRIRKSGHTTWHLASTVNGLEFLAVDVTSVISLHNLEVSTDNQNRSDSSNAEIEFSTGPPQYGALESVYENVSDSPNENSATEFKVRWADDREDGPFGLQTVESLIADGFIQDNCTFLVEGGNTWNSLASLGIQSISNKYFVMWEDGRTDGPFNFLLIQTLVSDGFISSKCTFKHYEGEQVIPFSSMNLNDMYTESFESKTTTTSASPSIPSLSTPASPTKEKTVKQKKQKKEREPRREGWLRRFVVKTTVSIAAISLIICLGSWGIWTALSDSQKVKVTSKYEEIKATVFGNDVSSLENASDPTLSSGAISESGQVSNSNQSTPPSTSQSPSSDGPIGNMGSKGNISVPQYGPMWVQQELNLPVIGSYACNVGNNSSLMPMLFLIPPSTEINGTLQLKAYYPAEQFGKQKWFWVNDNYRFITNGAGGPSEGIPSMGKNSAELLEVGDTFGIGNQYLQKKNLVRSWYNQSRYIILDHHIGGDSNDLRDPNKYSATIDEKTLNNVDRIELGGWNEPRTTRYLQFERDNSNRVIAVQRYDDKGNKLGTALRYKYDVDNSLLSFNTENYSNSARMDEWVPQYSSGKLISLNGTQHDNRVIETTYQYDSLGRISQISINIHKDEEVMTYKKNEINIDRSEAKYIATFAYKSNNEFWSTATLTGETTKSKIRGMTTAPEVEKNNLGFVRYEQTLTISR